MTKELTIAHLYPELLNIYGDYGNILTIKKRCEARNIKCNVEQIKAGENINPEKYDIFFIGGGQDKQQIEVSKELQKQKEALTEAAEQYRVFLGICGGYQLLGRHYLPHDGEKLEGISLLDVYTVAGNKRFIGNVTAESDFLTPRTLVGFENHAGLTYLEEGTVPIASVTVGNGNNGKDKTEGARKKNVFGTYLHGSVLPKNPHFADFLTALALNAKYENGKDKFSPEFFDEFLPKIDDDIEFRTHFSLVGKSY